MLAVLGTALTGGAGAEEQDGPSFVEQAAFCQTFVKDNFSGLLEIVRRRGYELYDIYDQVECDSSTHADLIKHRASLPTARSDIISLARYYIREHNDPDKVAQIFNRVIQNPGRPSGTLLDWVDFYGANPNLREEQREEFAGYEEVIRRFGGVREAELP